MSLAGLLFRFLLGGALVSLFAGFGTAFRPKTFAGLFGSAPPVALVSLGIALYEHGPAHVRQLSFSMAIGAVGLFAYSACCLVLIRSPKVPVAVGAVVSWLAWALVATTLSFSLLR